MKSKGLAFWKTRDFLYPEGYIHTDLVVVYQLCYSFLNACHNSINSFCFVFYKVVSDFENVNVDDPECVCMCVCVCAHACVRVRACVCVRRKRFLGNYWSHHRQTWRGDCLRHEKASRVNYIDLDLHSRSHILIMKIVNVWLFQKLFKQCPSSLLWW